MEIIDGKHECMWDGIITIFKGFDDKAKIKRIILTAFGDDNDKCITLDDCLTLIGYKGYHNDDDCVTVIFEDAMDGTIYNYGNYGAYWTKIGTTQGYW